MREETKSFISFGVSEAGLVFDDSNHEKYPLRFYNVIDNDGMPNLYESQHRSYFVFVYDGDAGLVIPDGIQAILPKDSYFATHGRFQLSGSYKAIVIEVLTDRGYYAETNYKAYTTIGGVVESVGRLKYIDGCTDSLLVSPVKKGDPCLNHLHFPKDITQTPHTHPSHRFGIVIRGNGECVTPFGNLPLMEGCVFVIKEYDGEEMCEGIAGGLFEAGTHKFNTYGSSMDVIAFHPDSDFGPEDEFHPMINRTIVNGVSANSLDGIKTK
jgi:hypothetical protein